MIHTGRHFLQIPGPTNVPDRILRAMDSPVIDHRSPEFAELGKEVLEGVRAVFKTAGPVVMYPASGTGAWEAALVNTLSPGDHVILFETGHFSSLWRGIAEKFGIKVDYVPGNWRRGASATELESRLTADRGHAIKAVLVVHNETSTGVTSRIPEVRRAIDAAKHPALLLVDTISSLASIDYRHDEWGVDVTIAGSQKGLMLPPGMSFNALSEKALRASLPRGDRAAGKYFQGLLRASCAAPRATRREDWSAAYTEKIHCDSASTFPASPSRSVASGHFRLLAAPFPKPR